ncbi:hypothetical protein BVX99_01645 [bacterium F16]|nr:hypothetical protein BVX99_01645 [bacterium F16]
MFNQLWILWALPLVLIPLVIHLLNRLRFRRVEWAAMSFIQKATKHSTRQAKLRQVLILAARMASILFLILALSRPLVGGWMGLALSSPPQTIIVLLDRSASMENRDASSGKTRRESALELMSGALKQQHQGARIILIENINATADEISPEILNELRLTGPTDSGADILKMVETALEYMLNNQTGKTELWIASDLQRSSWGPDNSRWASVLDQLRALSDKRGVMVRLLALGNRTPDNTSLTMSEAVRFRSMGRSFVDLSLSLQRFEDGVKQIPVKVELQGKSVAEMDVTMERSEHHIRKRLELPPDTGASWGRVVIPDDPNNTDNEAFFVFGEETLVTTAIFAESRKVAAHLALAAAPAPDSMKQRSQVVAPTELAKTDLTAYALVIWQGEMPGGEGATMLIDYMKQGGYLLCLPGQADGGHLGPYLSWSELEQSPDKSVYTIAHWDNTRGPLADSLDGKGLPIDELQITVRRIPVMDGKTLAEFSDNSVCLSSRSVGLGTLVACATLPLDDWSNLNAGPVLVPMVQRLLRSGAGRLAAATLAYCGEFKPEDGEEWLPLGQGAAEMSCDSRSGVYSFGGKLLAINRPDAEAVQANVQQDRLETMFSGLSFQLFSDVNNTGDKALPSETWRLLLYGLLMVLLVESALVLPPKVREGM